MTQSSDPWQGEERRGHRRIQDAVGLHLVRLQDMPAAGDPRQQTPTATSVRRANKYDIDGYAAVRRDQPDVAAYIDELEERIRELLLDSDSVASRPTHKVSVSASGIAFADDMLLKPGELVGITLTLFPGEKRIACDARIVTAGDAPEISNGDKPTYRAVFVRMTDQDRNTMVEHVETLVGSLPQSLDD